MAAAVVHADAATTVAPHEAKRADATPVRITLSVAAALTAVLVAAGAVFHAAVHAGEAGVAGAGLVRAHAVTVAVAGT
jgi:hypothetical protein